MRIFLIAFGAISLSSAEAPARVACPAPSARPLAWAITEVMSGDRYADVYIDLNDKGRATACRLGRNNLLGNDKFWVCNAFRQQWGSLAPARADAGPITVKRRWIEYGAKHAAAERAARDKYFREHPYERSECYPKDASTGRTVREPVAIGPAYAGAPDTR